MREKGDGKEEEIRHKKERNKGEATKIDSEVGWKETG